MASPFDKKGVYHSQLVKNSPLICTVKNNPQKSKHRGQPNYVIIVVDGEEHYLSLENQSCEEAMTGLAGQEVELNATGRDDSAEILATPLGEAPPQRQAPPARQQNATRQPARPPARPPAKAPPPQQAPPQKPPAKAPPKQRTPEEAIRDAKHEGLLLANMLLISYGMALYVREQLKEQRGIELTDSHVQVDAAKLYIDLKNAGFHRDLGHPAPDIRPKQAKTTTTTQPTS